MVGWPLSEANFSFSLIVGGVLGAMGSVVGGAAAVAVNSKFWIATIGIGAGAAAIVSGFAYFCFCSMIAAC